ncbi:hypothetical protein [Microvirga sp. TS319]
MRVPESAADRSHDRTGTRPGPDEMEAEIETPPGLMASSTVPD